MLCCDESADTALHARRPIASRYRVNGSKCTRYDPSGGRAHGCARLRTRLTSSAPHVGFQVLFDIKPPLSRPFKKHLATLGIVGLCSVPNALTCVILVQLGSRFHGPIPQFGGDGFWISRGNPVCAIRLTSLDISRGSSVHCFEVELRVIEHRQLHLCRRDTQSVAAAPGRLGHLRTDGQTR
jgi:hypothetical protein